MRNKIYFKLQLKKALKVYPVILIVTLITLASIIVTGIILVRNSASSEQKISLGVVGDVEGNYLSAGIYALENLDDARLTFDFTEMVKGEAVNALKNGEINGYIDIPDGFLESVFIGENKPVKYVTNSGAANLNTVLSGELTEILSSMVTETQSAIYSMQDIAIDNGLDDEFDEKIMEVNLLFLNFVLERNKLYDVEDLGVNDTISMGGYYVCGILLFFMLVWGISCNKLLCAKNITLSRALNAVGLKPAKQMRGEYLAYFAVTLVTLTVLAAVVGIFTGKNSMGIRELEDAGVLNCIGFVFALLPVIVMITMMQFAFCEFISNTVGAVLLQFLIAVGLGYISGCFYPNYFFPETVREIAAVLPSGAAFSYMKNLIAGELIWTDLGLNILYTVMFALLAVFARKRNVRVA